MTMYYGKSADGSDMKEFQGFYTSPCGRYWGSHPFTKDHPLMQSKNRPKKNRNKNPKKYIR